MWNSLLDNSRSYIVTSIMLWSENLVVGIFTMWISCTLFINYKSGILFCMFEESMNLSINSIFVRSSNDFASFRCLSVITGFMWP